VRRTSSPRGLLVVEAPIGDGPVGRATRHLVATFRAFRRQTPELQEKIRKHWNNGVA